MNTFHERVSHILDSAQHVTSGWVKKGTLQPANYQNHHIPELEEILKRIPDIPCIFTMQEENVLMAMKMNGLPMCPQYVWAWDTIFIFPIQNYREVSDYYSILFHELAHASGVVKNRLGLMYRRHSMNIFNICLEEIIAETSAMIIMEDLEIENDDLNALSYIRMYLDYAQPHITDSNRSYITAEAQRAYDWIMQKERIERCHQIE